MSMNRWLPLESNPSVMNKFITNMGMSDTWKFIDVYGLDDELLAIVPQPVAAVLLLYPLTKTAVDIQNKEEEELVANNYTAPDSVFFMKQFVSNACGTVALIHAVANNTDRIDIGNGAFKTFLDSCEGKDYVERGHLLESDGGIAKAHEDHAHEGQSEVPDREASVDNHFIALVHKDGKLYELDGRKSRPVEHGPTSNETLLNDAAAVCKKFMQRDPSESRFAIVALSSGQ